MLGLYLLVAELEELTGDILQTQALLDPLSQVKGAKSFLYF